MFKELYQSPNNNIIRTRVFLHRAKHYKQRYYKINKRPGYFSQSTTLLAERLKFLKKNGCLLIEHNITEEEGIPFTNWKGVYEYQEPVDLNSLSANFAVILQEVESLINSRTERKVILNDITQDKNKILEDERKCFFRFHRLETSMEESMTTFQSVFVAEQLNG